ncbi:MAG: SCO1664 family protein [Acidimicrobiia bacterium]
MELNSEAGVAEALRAAELEVVGRMRYSSNATFLVDVRADGLEMHAIYKPRRGERPLWDFPEGTLCHREVAAYELSDALGWGIVPVTIMRDGPLGEGAVQQFVAHDPDEHYFTLLDGREDRFRQFAVFDVLTNNTDRKGGHCLRDDLRDTVVGIDHGLTFHPAWKLRTVIWDFAGETVAESLRDDVCRAMDSLRDGALRDRLRPHLTDVELEAVEYRGRAVLAEGLPYPDDYRSTPWPLV